MSELFLKKSRPWNSVKGIRRAQRTSAWNRAKDWVKSLFEYRKKKGARDE